MARRAAIQGCAQLRQTVAHVMPLRTARVVEAKRRLAAAKRHLAHRNAQRHAAHRPGVSGTGRSSYTLREFGYADAKSIIGACSSCLVADRPVWAVRSAAVEGGRIRARRDSLRRSQPGQVPRVSLNPCAGQRPRSPVFWGYPWRPSGIIPVDHTIMLPMRNVLLISCLLAGVVG